MRKKPLHRRLREHVDAAGLSVSQIASATGWTYLRTLRLLRGKTVIKAVDMESIAVFMRRPVGDLFSEVSKGGRR